MYFLTVYQGNVPIVEKVSYADFSAAISACGKYYEPRAAGAALQFTTLVVHNTFMRAYAQLTRLEDLPATIAPDSPRRLRSIKDGNAFHFSHSYSFVIASQAGIDELARWEHEDA